MSETPKLSRRPYMLRAMHEWVSDMGLTPHVIVDAGRDGVEVPRQYVKDGKIVLNLSHSATQRLVMGKDWLEFDARFAGVVRHVKVPISAVLGVYARESGEGMVFAEQEQDPEPPPDKPTDPEESPKRPQLRVVK